MIPNFIHFVFGLNSDFGDKGFSFVHYLAVVSAWKVNRPENIFFHYCYEPNGIWWENAKPYLSLNRINSPTKIFDRPLEHYAHKADVVRLEVLMKYGGIYLDMDVICINSFKPLLQEVFVMGEQPRRGLGNSVMLARRESEFLRIWYESYRDFDGNRYDHHSIAIPHTLAQRYPSLIHVLDEYAFFYPMWQDPTQNALWSDKSPIWHWPVLKKVIRHIYVKTYNMLSSSRLTSPYPPLSHLLGGREWQFDRLKQSYCIHLWETAWWNQLQQLTPQVIVKNNGNLPRIIRQVLGQDLIPMLFDTRNIDITSNE